MIDEQTVELMLHDFWLSSGKASVMKLTREQKVRFKIQVEYDRSIHYGTMVDLNHGRLMFYLPEKQSYRTFSIDKIVSIELLNDDDEVLARCTKVDGLDVLEPKQLKKLGISMERKKD